MGVLATAAFCQAAESVEHSFFVCGWKSGGPALYDEQFQKTWGLSSMDELTDGWVLSDGGVVYSFSKRKQKIAGVIRLDANKNKVWEYQVPQGHDNHSCQPLPHGGFLLGETSLDALWMLEIDKDGKEIKRVQVADKVKDIHHAFRAVRKTEQGTYLATLMKPVEQGGKTLKRGCAHEWDASGKLIRTFPSGLFHAIRLPDGHTLVTEGHGNAGRAVTEYDENMDVVWELTSTDLEAMGIRLSMVCGVHRLPNGNTVVTNVEHGKKFLGAETGPSPKAFEVTPDKQVVWQIPSSVSDFNMGSIQILNINGRVDQFEVYR
jgi:hypothetical protein